MKYLIRLIVLSLIGANAFAIPPFEQVRLRLQGPAAGAHMGGLFWGYEPDTIENFKLATSRGADVVEMDLRISKDGIPVVFHDPTLGNRTHCQGPVAAKTLSELKQCKFLNSTEKITAFEEVMAWNKGQVVVNAEFKDDATIVPALALVHKYKAHAWTYFQTQDNHGKFLTARALDPDVALLFRVTSQSELNWALALNDPALIIIEIEKAMRNPGVINQVHAAGKLVSEDSFDFDIFKEFFVSHCYQAFAMGIDIGISNRVRGCVEQKRGF